MAQAGGTPDIWGNGQAYERYMGRWSRVLVRQFLAWLDLPPGQRWLDVGCGTGALTQAIVQEAAPRSVLSVDRSAAFVAFARHSTPDERAQFEVMDAQQPTVEPGRVDASVSALVLNFVPEPARMVEGMARAARPGGWVAACVWDYGGTMELMQHFWRVAARLDPAAAALDEGQRFSLCRPEALQALFAGAGLDHVETTALDIHTDFPDFDDYWTPFLGGQGAAPGYAVTLDEERRAALRERLRAELPFAPDGSLPLRARAWAIRGRRV